MPRLYREMPLASIWEGSGNVMALDVLRALAREPAALDAFVAELDEAAGADARLDAFCARLRVELADRDALELRARRLVEQMAPRAAGRAARAPRAGGGRRRVLRLAPGGRRRAAVRHAAGRRRLPRRSSRVTRRPPPDEAQLYGSKR